MQLALNRPANPRQPWLLAGLGLLTLLVAALAGLLFLLSGAGTPAYRRFVSRPLPDGSRFSFLYPAHLQDQVEGPGGSPKVSHGAAAYTADQSLSTWDWMRCLVGLPVPPVERVSRSSLFP